MSGLFGRIRRSRAAAAEESRTETPAPSEPQDATTTAERPGGGSLLVDPATPRPTTVPPSPLAEMRDLPAGLEVEELRSPRPATERRSRLRRRARYLRRVRELLLRDLGGLVYEIHRTTGGDRLHHESLVRAKAERLGALDSELFALEKRLGAEHPETVLREPGVGGSCASCGELHASDARFCSACGTSLSGRTSLETAEEPLPAGEPASGAPTQVLAGSGSRAPEEPRLDESQATEEPRLEESQAAEGPRLEESQAAEEPRLEESQAAGKARVGSPTAPERSAAQDPRVERPGAAEEPRTNEGSVKESGHDTGFAGNGRDATSPDFAVRRPS